MKNEAIWQAFARTGDPVYYLLYKELDRAEPENKEMGSGARPLPGD